MAGNEQLLQTLRAALQTKHHLPVSRSWLMGFLVSVRQNPPPPLPALTSTALFRLLNSDFTSSLCHAALDDYSTPQPPQSLGSVPPWCLPPDVGDVNVKERRLGSDDHYEIPVQVLDVEDIGTSRWSQVEAIERAEAGEMVRGREIIRVVDVERSGADGGHDGQAQRAGAGNGGRAGGKVAAGPHKLLLQDTRGTKVVGFEMSRISKIGIADEGMAVGMKLLLKAGVVVRRGMLMLTPDTVVVLGGKIETWDRAWREGRKERLKQQVERESHQGT